MNLKQKEKMKHKKKKDFPPKWGSISSQFNWRNPFKEKRKIVTSSKNRKRKKVEPGESVILGFFPLPRFPR